MPQDLRMTSEPLIRIATLDDEPGIKQIRASAGWMTEYTARAFAEMQIGRRMIYVAVQDGRPVGTVQLLLVSSDRELADGRHVAHLSDLAVLPALQRRGLGRRLVAHVEAVAAARGYSTLTLDVDESQPDTQRLYERWGYIFFRQSISPWGTWLHGMRKALVPHEVRG
jgi:ribosomal protein S18 acetylase RimI-like enzyme